MPKSSKIPRIRKIRKQNTSILNQKNLVPVKLGKKNIMIAGIKNPAMISTLIIIFSMSSTSKDKQAPLMGGAVYLAT